MSDGHPHRYAENESAGRHGAGVAV